MRKPEELGTNKGILEMEEEKGWKRVAAAAVVLVVMVFLTWIQISTNNPWWELIDIPLNEALPLLCVAQLLMIVFYLIYQNLV